jgi:hypothetical protein
VDGICWIGESAIGDSMAIEKPVNDSATEMDMVVFTESESKEQQSEGYFGN